VYYPTDVSLGAVTPTEFLANPPTVPNQFTIQWDPACNGKWCASSDTLYGFSSSAAPPDQPEFVRNLPHVERSEGEATVEVGDIHHDASVYVWGWWKHALSSYRSIWSPTRHVVAEIASGNPYYYTMTFDGSVCAYRAGNLVGGTQGTVAWWMKFRQAATTSETIFSIGGSNYPYGAIRVRSNGTATKLECYFLDNAQGQHFANTAYEISPNVWHACAVSSNGDSYRFWCDGVELADASGGGHNDGLWFGEISPNSPYSYIGCQYASGSQGVYFIGDLCNIFLDPSPWGEADAIAFHEWYRAITSLPRYYPFTTSGVYLIDNAFGGLDMRWYNDTPPTFSGPYLGAPT